MKIKLAILEKDKTYLNRINAVFGSKFSDKCQIHCFTELEVALETLDKARIDVLLAADCFDIDRTMLPRWCGFAYLVDSRDIDMVKDEQAICKFQPADLLYKQVLMIYSDNAGQIGFRTDGNGARKIAFTGVGGGCGTSTMAAACARHYAARGTKVLYLNLERFGSADLYFSGQGSYDMSDVIFAVKGKKDKLNIKLDGCVKQDASGVSFFSPAKIALDMMELSGEDLLLLIETLSKQCDYDYLIVDVDFSLEEKTLQLMRQMHAIVLVGSGSQSSNLKTERAYGALNILESGADLPLTRRMSFLHNNIDNNGKAVNIPELRVLGHAPGCSGMDTERLLAQLQQMDEFENIL